MKDPRGSIATRLPGLATHFGKDHETACGMNLPADRMTSDLERVNCRRCLKSPLWKFAWNIEVMKEIRDDKQA